MAPAGATRNLPEVLQTAEQASQVISNQVLQIATAAVAGDRVILEVNWSAKLKLDLPDNPAGGQIRSRIAIFLTIRDGLVAAQQNCDANLPDSALSQESTHTDAEPIVQGYSPHLG